MCSTKFACFLFLRFDFYNIPCQFCIVVFITSLVSIVYMTYSVASFVLMIIDVFKVM